MDTDGPDPPARRTHSAGAPSGERSAGGELLVTLPAAADSASLLRRRLRRWLLAWRWPERELDDVVLAVDEAVANVVDHAYRDEEPGTAQVYAWVSCAAGARRVVVSVIDRGRWRPPPADPGHRGRGLMMMRACTASVHIENCTGGTAVTMVSTPVPDSALCDERSTGIDRTVAAS